MGSVVEGRDGMGVDVVESRVGREGGRAEGGGEGRDGTEGWERKGERAGMGQRVGRGWGRRRGWDRGLGEGGGDGRDGAGVEGEQAGMAMVMAVEVVARGHDLYRPL